MRLHALRLWYNVINWKLFICVYLRIFDKKGKICSHRLGIGVRKERGQYIKERGDFLVRKMITIDNESGLHLRPAGKLVTEANRCKSHVMMIHGEYKMNCKSLMSLLAFPVCPGDEVIIECEGEDEELALEKIVNFLKNGI